MKPKKKMRLFKVVVMETNSRTINVWAADPEQAECKARNLYENGGCLLDDPFGSELHIEVIP